MWTVKDVEPTRRVLQITEISERPYSSPTVRAHSRWRSSFGAEATFDSLKRCSRPVEVPAGRRNVP